MHTERYVIHNPKKHNAPILVGTLSLNPGETKDFAYLDADYLLRTYGFLELKSMEKPTFDGSALIDALASQPVTKDDLKEALDERGIEYPSNAKKADLQALLEEVLEED